MQSKRLGVEAHAMRAVRRHGLAPEDGFSPKDSRERISPFHGREPEFLGGKLDNDPGRFRRTVTRAPSLRFVGKTQEFQRKLRVPARRPFTGKRTVGNHGSPGVARKRSATRSVRKDVPIENPAHPRVGRKRGRRFAGALRRLVGRRLRRFSERLSGRFFAVLRERCPFEVLQPPLFGARREPRRSRDRRVLRLLRNHRVVFVPISFDFPSKLLSDFLPNLLLDFLSKFFPGFFPAFLSEVLSNFLAKPVPTIGSFRFPLSLRFPRLLRFPSLPLLSVQKPFGGEHRLPIRLAHDRPFGRQPQKR